MKKDFSCGECREKLSDYQLGFTNERENAIIEKHLKDCPECRAELEELEAVENMLHELEPVPLPADFKSNLHRSLAAESEKLQSRGKNGGFSALLGRIFAKNRVFVPVLTALVLVAVFSTGIYELMLNQNAEVERYNQTTRQTSTPDGNNAEIHAPADSASPSDAPIDADAEPTSGKGSTSADKSNASVTQAPSAAEKADETAPETYSEPVPTSNSEQTGEDTNGASVRENENGGESDDSDSGNESKESAMSEESAESDEADEYGTETYGNIPSAASVIAQGDENAVYAGGGSGGASAPRMAVGNICEVRIKVRNPYALLENLGLSERAEENDGVYSLYLNEEEYRSLISSLPKSAEVSGEASEDTVLYHITVEEK